MTKARDLANIISGGFTVDDIPNIPASKITSGTFTDDRLPATALNSNVDLTNLSASNLTSGTIPVDRITALPAGVGGKVLQVVTGTSTTQSTTTSTSYQASTLSVAITPSATSSKIYVNASFPAHVIGTGSGDNGGQYTIYKDSSAVIAVAGDAFYTNNGTGLSLRQNLSVLNSPSTTSAITYKIYFKNRAGTSTQGIMTNGGEGTITAMEIGA